ncbi:hypothetical protein F5X96DRAFT_522342 [Biscogniauxia mediterranea]|nr:hypothetical protein F5X96DRAFT_522342 [Biscogniauxia mediterranea]
MAFTCIVGTLFFFLSFSPCFASHGGRQYDYGHDVNRRIHERGLAQSFIVGGLPPVDGKVQLRQEVRELEKDKDKWELYILALSWMQYTDQGSPFSFYQVAGIHGAPGLTWASVDASPGSENKGYCPHASILFPTWHRPYVALYEQILYNIVQYIASLYPPDRLERFQKLAKSFRLPYWDWAATPQNGDSVLPLSIGGSPTIEISGPNGIQTISNPLFSFTFKPFNGSIFRDSPYNLWNETKRAPWPVTAPDAVSNNSYVALWLDSHLPSYQQRLYNLFANYPNYSTFSNEAWIPYGNNGTYDSIESLHDSIHTAGGGGWGHLAIILYSAFDPLFFLHHANVDRIFSMWQLIYNNSYVVPTPALYGTHTTSQGQIEDSRTPLTPFFANGTSFWTSNTVRDHEVFGYTYPEVANKSRAEVIDSINSLYTRYSPATMLTERKMKLLKGGRDHADEKMDQTSSQSRSHKSNALAWNHLTSAHLPMNAVFRGNSYREWIANIRVNRQALNTSFSIYLFIGTVPSDPTSWPFSDNLVGSLGVLANNGPQVNMQHGKITGTIPLTSALMSLISARNVPSLDPDDIVPFLKSQLQLRIALRDSVVVDSSAVDGLWVNIVSSAVTAPRAKHVLAQWGEIESHFELIA